VALTRRAIADAVFIGSGQRYSFLLERRREGNEYLMKAYARKEFIFDNPNVENINKHPEALDECNPVTGVLEYASPDSATVNENSNSKPAIIIPAFEQFDFTRNSSPPLNTCNNISIILIA